MAATQPKYTPGSLVHEWNRLTTIELKGCPIDKKGFSGKFSLRTPEDFADLAVVQKQIDDWHTEQQQNKAALLKYFSKKFSTVEKFRAIALSLSVRTSDETREWIKRITAFNVTNKVFNAHVKFMQTRFKNIFMSRKNIFAIAAHAKFIDTICQFGDRCTNPHCHKLVHVPAICVPYNYSVGCKNANCPHNHIFVSNSLAKLAIPFPQLYFEDAFINALGEENADLYTYYQNLRNAFVSLQ